MITWRPALIWARSSLAVRVALTSGITLLLLGVLLIASFLREDIEQVRRSMTTVLAQEIALLAATLVEPAVVGDYTLIRQLLTVRAADQDVQRIAWTDNLGHALAVHGPAVPAAPTWFALLADVPDVEREQAILVGGQSYGKISVRLTAASRIHAIWSATTARMALAAMGISICIALTAWIVLRGLLPFSDLAHAARRFGRGEHGLRIKATGPPESRSCIDAFNRMGADIEGRVFVRDLAAGRLSAELRKTAGQSVDLGLEPGLHAVFHGLHHSRWIGSSHGWCSGNLRSLLAADHQTHRQRQTSNSLHVSVP